MLDLNKTITPEKLVDSALAIDSKYMKKWCYEFGLILKSFESVYHLTGNKHFLEIIKDQMDRFILEDGEILDFDIDELNLDHVNPGKMLLFLYEKTSLEKYKTAAQKLRLQLQKQPRNLHQGFWHKRIYPHQMWLDGLYMSSPFLTQYGVLFNEPEAFDDVANQVTLLAEHTLDPATGLHYHAWDESRGMKWANDKTGCSPHFWGRAMGWFVMALVDILDFFPASHPKRDYIANVLNNTLQALVRVQDEKTGVWYQIVDKGHVQGNYLESSVSCMVTYALLKGMRKGYLDTSMKAASDKAYQGILEQFAEISEDGIIHLRKVCAVAGLGGNPYRDGSLAYYFSEPVATDDFKGYGPFILATSEYFQSKQN